ncbi:MAG: Signal transduction histidine kinase [Syntrophus sp. (in: bacteria)]|nr:Signal transduction histidine kinase [Syntrophus sp. (in: bacteria)]
MHLRTLFVLLILGVMAAFAAVNWNSFMAPTTLSLLFATIQAPLGLIMLGFTALLMAVFLLFIAYLQASLLVDTRRHTRELLAQRTLADQAEASRIAELRSYLEAGLPKLEKEIVESRVAVETHLDQLDRDLRSAVEEAGNTLAAYIGELEDRLERGGNGFPSFHLRPIGIIQ